MVTSSANSLLVLQLWVALGGIAIPMVVALLAKSTLEAHFKSILNLGLTALAAGVATVVQQGGHVSNWQVFGVSILTAWVSSVTSYYGLWKPSTLAPKVTQATASFGLGRRLEAAASGLAQSPNRVVTAPPSIEIPADPNRNSAFDDLSGGDPKSAATAPRARTAAKKAPEG